MTAAIVSWIWVGIGRLLSFLSIKRVHNKNILAQATGSKAEVLIDKEHVLDRMFANQASPFVCNNFLFSLCPEAQGHFCMLWGEHGHGGYDSTLDGYVQGGQPMDVDFELANLYFDFKEAQKSGDWLSMRSVTQKIRELRFRERFGKTKERSFRVQSLY